MNKDILVLIQINEEQYNNMFLDFGMNYCEHYTAGDNAGSTSLKESAYFWKWWHNQYATIDKAFIKSYSNSNAKNENVIEFLREKYKRMHNPIFMEIYPSDWVIQGALSGIVYGKKQKQEIC